MGVPLARGTGNLVPVTLCHTVTFVALVIGSFISGRKIKVTRRSG